MTRGSFGPNRRRENGENGSVIDCIERKFLKFRLTAQRRRHGCEPSGSPSSRSRIGWNVRRKVNAFSLSKKGAIRRCSRSIRDSSGCWCWDTRAQLSTQRFRRASFEDLGHHPHFLFFSYPTYVSFRNNRILHSKWIKIAHRMSLIKYELRYEEDRYFLFVEIPQLGFIHVCWSRNWVHGQIPRETGGTVTTLVIIRVTQISGD